MASRILASASSALEPVAMQPGRSGTYAEKLPWARSMTTAYRMVQLLGSRPDCFRRLFTLASAKACWITLYEVYLNG